ncbi:MAG: trypsin-like peptidase domain-containing protein [Planctomycetaceae bacterium]|nr:trypsin-like peptidase domain-containing protein [Planctomycetaceae bacterium]
MLTRAGNRLTLIAACLLLTCAVAHGAEPRGVVYKFGATWCGPCQRVAPMIERLEREGLPIQSVDIDQQEELANRFRVDRVPTFILVVDGQEMDRVVGMMTEGEVRKMVAKIPAGATTRPAETQIASPSPPRGPFEISLGQSAPMRRPDERPVQEQSIAPVTPERGGLANLWPFGRREEAPPTVRGNDSSLETLPAIGTNAFANDAMAANDPMSASIRIRVKLGDKMNLGSGAIISSRPGYTLIMTCGHIFRDFTSEGKIEVDVFQDGRSVMFLAKLEKFDLDADVGLISIPTESPLAHVAVAQAAAAPAEGEPVACIGCSGGENPTREQIRVTAVDKYVGPHNIECTGIPVRGRSGGGLFNQQGELVGVCIAADTKGQRGLYAGLHAIHGLLDDCGLTALYQPAPPTQPTQPVSQPDLLAGRANDPFGATTTEPLGQPELTPPAGLTTDTLAANPLDVATGDAEVVVIIRDRNQPQSQNRVVIIHQASPSFLKYLDGELGSGASPSGTALGSRPAPARESLVPAMDRRTQSAPVQPASYQTQRPTHSSSSLEPAVRMAKHELEPTSLPHLAPAQRYVRTAIR